MEPSPVAPGNQQYHWDQSPVVPKAAYDAYQPHPPVVRVHTLDPQDKHPWETRVHEQDVYVPEGIAQSMGKQQEVAEDVDVPEVDGKTVKSPYDGSEAETMDIKDSGVLPA